MHYAIVNIVSVINDGIIYLWIDHSSCIYGFEMVHVDKLKIQEHQSILSLGSILIIWSDLQWQRPFCLCWVLWLWFSMTSVTWSPTERREIKNFPYPSMFELTDLKDWPLKGGIRNVGQLLGLTIKRGN